MSNVGSLFDRRGLTQQRDLLRELVARDLKLRYKRSVLGIAWSLITPLLQLLVFYFLFQVILSLDINRYSSYTLTGLLVWSWFQTSLLQSASAITGNRELIRRPGFPASVLPVVTVTTNFIHFLLALPILLIALWIDGSSLGLSVASLPILMAVQFALTLGLAYLVAGANVVFADTEHLLGVLLMLFFFLTPIFYDASAVPERFQPFYLLNPLAQLLALYRTALVTGSSLRWASVLALAVLSAILLPVGYKFFVRVSYRFVDEL